MSSLVEGQPALFSGWPPLGTGDDDKRRLVAQLIGLDATTPGGLVGYVGRAKDLLAASRKGTNPLEGFRPAVPDGTSLQVRSDGFATLERAGMAEAGSTAFVLVAGGLGERLGYSGIKVALPSEGVRKAGFLELYAEYILAFQKRSSAKAPLPFAIMTSGDTDAKTRELLEAHAYFGLSPSQVHFLKQDKVPCLADNEATLAVDPKDRYTLQTKPHGHGDVHSLLHTSGLVSEWAAQGLKWLCFFQDTNALVFRAIPAALALSAREGYAVNSIAVPRKAKEAIGAICKLERQDGSCMTLNVEYNQLDPLLRSTVNPEGDVNEPSTGLSPYPGNINQLIFSIPDYDRQLKETNGQVPEFVNPKYKDSAKTAFKSPTRLECMMQDYPRTLPASSKVGFTVFEVWNAYSPVKNSPEEALKKFQSGNPSHSATTGEFDIYTANARILEHLGSKLEPPKVVTYNGIDVEVREQRDVFDAPSPSPAPLNSPTPTPDPPHTQPK